MLSDNLQEMLQQTDGDLFGSSAVQETTGQDTVNSDKVLTWDDEIEPSQSQTEDVKKENDIPPVPNYPETVTSNFQAKSEEDLINHTKYLYARMEVSVVMTYWHIGQAINSFYQKEYGRSKLKGIANETGIKLDTLHKACKFARAYSEEEVEILLNGRFVMAWNHIAHNLSIEPKDLLEVYRGSNSPGEFHNAIIKFKSPNENRGKIRKVETEEPVEPTVVNNTEMEEIKEEEKPSEPGSRETLDDGISVLRDELATKEQRIEELKGIVDKMRIEIEEKEALISDIKQGLSRVRDMGEDDADKWAILEAIEDLSGEIQ